MQWPGSEQSGVAVGCTAVPPSLSAIRPVVPSPVLASPGETVPEVGHPAFARRTRRPMRYRTPPGYTARSGMADAVDLHRAAPVRALRVVDALLRAIGIVGAASGARRVALAAHRVLRGGFL